MMTYVTALSVKMLVFLFSVIVMLTFEPVSSTGTAMSDTLDCKQISLSELNVRWEKMSHSRFSVLESRVSGKQQSCYSSSKNILLRRRVLNLKRAFERFSCKNRKFRRGYRRHRRTKRSTCFQSGTTNNNGLLRLCTECMGKKVLDASWYPREFSEISCSNQDNTCLLSDGSCVQQYASAVVLRKTGRCNECNGTRKEEWVPDVVMLKVGCTCQLRPGSAFTLLL